MTLRGGPFVGRPEAEMAAWAARWSRWSTMRARLQSSERSRAARFRSGQWINQMRSLACDPVPAAPATPGR